MWVEEGRDGSVAVTGPAQARIGWVPGCPEPSRRTTGSGRSTAVGKAILANYPDEEVIALLGRTGMQRHTDRTLVTPEAFLKELAEVRRLGYAVDEGEQEIGVRCVGVAVPETPQPMALSMSGPLARVNDEVVQRAHQVLREAASEIRAVLSRTGSGD